MTDTVAVDARPVLPVSLDSLWDRAAARRDAIAVSIADELERGGVRAWVAKSKPAEYPPSVVVNSWIERADDDLTVTLDRSSLKVEITVDPYREAPLQYRVLLARHARSFSNQDWDLSDTEIRECAAYLLHGGSKPKFFRPRLSWPLRVIGGFLPFGPFVHRNKLIRAARPNWLTLPFGLVVAGGLTALFGIGLLNQVNEDGNSLSALAMLAGLLTLGLWTAAFLFWRRRPVLDSIPKQPTRTPRREFRIDSWHVSVPGAGKDFAAFRQRLLRCLKPADDSITMGSEVHENLTPRGFEERERFVLSKGQATLHVHIYPYGEDAFVGWDSYLNWHRWAEGDVAAGTVRDGATVKYRNLDVGVHVPTDFDLIESDLLSETSHRNLAREIKLFLKEAEMEADLDFNIVRGDRDTALERGNKPEPKKKAPARPRVAYY